MKSILIFILGTVAGKLIEDNLPKMNRKNIIAFFRNRVLPLLIGAGFAAVCYFAKLTGNKQLEKNCLTALALFTAVILLQRAITAQKNVAVI